VIEEDLARDGQARGAAHPGEERGSHLALELLDLPAQRGLGNVQATRCPKEMLLLGDRDE
jgi:hypothetical protein